MASHRIWKSEKEILIRSPYQSHQYDKDGSGTFPPGLPPQKNANNVVEIEAEMIQQYFSSRSWIDETTHC